MNPVIDKERCVKLDRDEVLHNARNYWIWRRSQDIVLSVLALLILWPWMLLIAIIIVIDSPGASPIFAQERVGRDGKKFTFYKFRSMKPNAEAELDDLLDQNEMDGPVFKIKKDPRITRVGRFIRRASIDELPQLWNVLRGEMSIVGPRPSLVREAEQYDDYARQRLYVTPGLTCYWQTQPNRNDMSFDEWVELDLKYIQERSFWVDWMIIFKTFQAVFGMNGV
jgi:lipopolysaccharide/colanic/teichoic acid biosynthesis glycosyltransferase